MAVEPKTKADQEKMGEGAAAPGRGRSDLPRASRTRKPARSSSPAWASCTWKSSATACSASSRSRPTPARRRSPIAKRSPKPPTAKASSSSSPAVAVNTATSCVDVRPERARQGRRDREQDRRRHDSQGIHPAGQERHRGSHAQRRHRRLPGHRHQGRHRRRQLSTKWTRTNWRSRWPASSRSRTPSRRRTAILLEPIMKVEVIDARRVPGRHHGRPQPPPRQDQRHRDARTA